MKEKWIYVLSFWVILAASILFSNEADAAKQIEVIIDGEKQIFEQPPKNINGSVLVPMRHIFEYFDVDVSWDAKTKTIYGNKNELSLKLEVGSKQALINNKQHILNTAPAVINSTTMVPLRFVGEALGTYVSWAKVTEQVIISTHYGKLSGQAKLDAYARIAHDTDGELYRWKINYDDGSYTFMKIANEVLHVGVYYEQPMYVKYDGTVWGWDWYTWDEEKHVPAKQFKGINNAIKVVPNGTYSLNSIDYIDKDKKHWFYIDFDGTPTKELIESNYSDLAYLFKTSRGYTIDSKNNLYAFGRPYAAGFEGDANLLGTGQVNEDTIGRYYSNMFVTGQVKQIDAGNWHSVILKTDGTAWTWGANKFGELGDGTSKTRFKPVKIASGVKQVVAGNSSTLLLKHDGSVWGAGHYSSGIHTHLDVNYDIDPFGIIEDYTPNPTLTKLEGVPPFTTIAADHSIGYGLTHEGDIYIWGRMYDGSQIKPELLVKDGIIVYQP